MFVKVKNQFNEEVLINTDNIVSVKRQADGDIFARFVNGESIKLTEEFFKTIERICL